MTDKLADFMMRGQAAQAAVNKLTGEKTEFDQGWNRAIEAVATILENEKGDRYETKARAKRILMMKQQ